MQTIHHRVTEFAELMRRLLSRVSYEERYSILTKSKSSPELRRIVVNQELRLIRVQSPSPLRSASLEDPCQYATMKVK